MYEGIAPTVFISLRSLLRRSEQQLQADAESSTPILDEAQALVEIDGIVPGGVGLHDDAPVAVLAGDVHQGGDVLPGRCPVDDSPCASRSATSSLIPSPCQRSARCRPVRAPGSHHEDMARSEVVVQNIIQVRVERFVDVAEVFA